METVPPALTNPYHADYADEDALASAPFAGRRALLDWLYQTLMDGAPRPLTITGGRQMGKTAALHAFAAGAADGLLTAYVPLKTLPADQTELVLTIAQALTAALIDRGLNVQRLNAVSAPGDDPRGWLTGDFFPVALAIARPYRRVVLLLDDAERVLTAAAAGRLPADLPVWLAGLPATYPLLGLVLTISADYADDAPTLAPLIDPAALRRLEPLSAAETRHLLTDPARGCYAVPEEISQQAHTVTGGHPALVQQLGWQMFSRWEAVPERNTIDSGDLKALLRPLVDYADGFYRADWLRLSANERSVLLAIEDLQPLTTTRAIDAAAVVAWLLETDHPLDAVAVGAALRALEFRGLVRVTGVGGTAPGGRIAPTATLYLLWLRSHGDRLPRRVTASVSARRDDTPAAATAPRPLPAGWVIGIGAVIGLIVGAVVLAVLAGQGAIALPPFAPVPTITLVP